MLDIPEDPEVWPQDDLEAAWLAIRDSYPYKLRFMINEPPVEGNACCFEVLPLAGNEAKRSAARPEGCKELPILLQTFTAESAQRFVAARKKSMDLLATNREGAQGYLFFLWLSHHELGRMRRRKALLLPASDSMWCAKRETSYYVLLPALEDLLDHFESVLAAHSQKLPPASVGRDPKALDFRFIPPRPVLPSESAGEAVAEEASADREGLAAQNRLAKVGASWEFAFKGVAYEPLSKSVGTHYLAQLLSAEEGVWLEPHDIMKKAGRKPNLVGEMSGDDSAKVLAEGLSAVDGFDEKRAPDGEAASEYMKHLRRVRKEMQEIVAECEERPGGEPSDGERARIEILRDDETRLLKEIGDRRREKRGGGRANVVARSKNAAAVWAGLKSTVKETAAQDGGSFKKYVASNVKRIGQRFRLLRDVDDSVEWDISFGREPKGTERS
jgi:hypothetical protein